MNDYYDCTDSMQPDSRAYCLNDGLNQWRRYSIQTLCDNKTLKAKCDNGITYGCQTIDGYIVAQCNNNNIKYCAYNTIGQTCNENDDYGWECIVDINNTIISVGSCHGREMWVMCAPYH